MKKADKLNNAQSADNGKSRAVVLLSGGLDSSVCCAIALKEGFSVYALSFAYGQRHRMELVSASRMAKTLDLAEHKILNIELGALGGSALTTDIAVPKHKNVSEIGSEIPLTYVPARNTVFLSFGLAYAEVLGASDIFIGVNTVDFSGYPDCRPEYIKAFQKMANLATKGAISGKNPIKINTPLLNMTKAEIILKGTELGVDFTLTHSCYDPLPDWSPCGKCDSCLLRLKGFKEAGLKDPLPYR